MSIYNNRVCQQCGAEIIINSARQKYCAECAKIAIKEFDRKKSLYYHYNFLDKSHRKEVRKKRYILIKDKLNIKRRIKRSAKNEP